MSKIGKKYNLYNSDSFEQRAVYDTILNGIKDGKITVQNINETFNSSKNGYEGSIVLSSTDLNSLTNLIVIIRDTLKIGFSDFSNDLTESAIGTFAITGLENTPFGIPQLPPGSLNNTSLNINFNLEGHYEELKELTGIKILLSGSSSTDASAVTASLADNLNVYKFKSPLEYNFLNKVYETNQSSIEEKSLPFFYEILANNIDSDTNNNFNPEIFNNPLSNVPRPELQQIHLPYSLDYENKSLRIDKYLEKFNGFKEQFPFYADISFDTQLLKQNSLSNLILNEKSLFASCSLATKLVTSYPPFFEISLVDLNISPIAGLLYSFEGEKVSAYTVNLDSILLNYMQGKIDSNKDYLTLFGASKIINDNKSSFLSVMSGQPEYSEVFGFNLRKYESETSQDPIQEVFFPNTSEGKLFWIDTQIKYGKKYTYRLDPIILSFMTQYKYTSYNLVQNSTKNTLELKFFYRKLPRLFIFKNLTTARTYNLGANYTNTLLDFPPIEPEVEIVPYIGIDNKVKLNLNTSIGKKTVPAINIGTGVEGASEIAKKDLLRNAQNIDRSTNLLTFQTDEPADFIEIYKIEGIKPSSYDDFSGKRTVRLSTNNTSGASFIDTIEPNKKYYYIARCIDYHQNTSNPTPLYEVELISDNGLIIPIINVVDFDRQENKKEKIKTFKRLLKIQPAIRHRLVNENPEKTNQNNIELGNDTIKPWGKNFKLRITSKSTGKKIDINFNFNYKKG